MLRRAVLASSRAGTAVFFGWVLWAMAPTEPASLRIWRTKALGVGIGLFLTAALFAFFSLLLCKNPAGKQLGWTALFSAILGMAALIVRGWTDPPA